MIYIYIYIYGHATQFTVSHNRGWIDLASYKICNIYFSRELEMCSVKLEKMSSEANSTDIAKIKPLGRNMIEGRQILWEQRD